MGGSERRVIDGPDRGESPQQVWGRKETGQRRGTRGTVKVTGEVIIGRVGQEAYALRGWETSLPLRICGPSALCIPREVCLLGIAIFDQGDERDVGYNRIVINGAEIDTYESWGSISRSIVSNDAGKKD